LRGALRGLLRRPTRPAAAFGAISAVGFGIVATHVVATAVARVADQRRRGLAIGTATSGSTAGQFVVVPAMAALLATASWRWSFAALALALATSVLVPLVWLALRERRPAAPEGPQLARPAPRNPAADLRQLASSPVFHALFWSFLLCGYTTTGVVETHLLPCAAFCGFPPVPSATAYGLLSLVNMDGMVLAGWLADRVNRPLCSARSTSAAASPYCC
jgi:MFS family permease